MIRKNIPPGQLLLFFFLISLQVGLLTTLSAEEGTKPATFCVPTSFRSKLCP